jgi:hypothetical protein
MEHTEIPTAAAPENAMADRRRLRVSGGLRANQSGSSIATRGAKTYKLRVRFCELQSSTRTEKTARTGIDRRLRLRLIRISWQL